MKKYLKKEIYESYKIFNKKKKLVIKNQSYFITHIIFLNEPV